MMTFRKFFTAKCRRETGEISMVTVLVISTLILIGLATVVQLSRQGIRNLATSEKQSRILMSTHSVAALIKDDLLTNWDRFKTAGGPWQPCRMSVGLTGAVTVVDFLNLLQAPPTPACNIVPFVFAHFGTLANPLVPTQVPLMALKAADLVPLRPINGFRAVFKMSEFNIVDGKKRYQIGGTFGLQTINDKVPLQTQVKFVIDGSRTLNEAVRIPYYGICRNVPGSICPKGRITLVYRDTTARLRYVKYDLETGTTKIDFYDGNEYLLGTVASVKVGKGSPTVYRKDGFCNSGLSSGLIIDSAKAKDGDYFLTTYGNIVTQSSSVTRYGYGLEIWTHHQQQYYGGRVHSIAFKEGIWYVLLSGGLESQVLWTTDITQPPSSFLAIEGISLKSAWSLAMGEGAAACQ